MGQSAWAILFGLAEALDWGSCLCDLCEQREGGTHHFLDLSLGAGFLGIRNRALIGCISQRAVGRERRMLTLDVLCCPKPSSRSQPSF